MSSKVRSGGRGGKGSLGSLGFGPGWGRGLERAATPRRERDRRWFMMVTGWGVFCCGGDVKKGSGKQTRGAAKRGDG